MRAIVVVVSAVGSATPTERVRYAERLWPSTGVWVVAMGLAVTVGLVFYPVGGLPGVVTGAVAAVAVATAVMVWWSPQVRVVDVANGAQLVPGDAAAAAVTSRTWLQAGTARIPISALGVPVALSAGQWSASLGPALDGRSYRCVRGWIRTGVRVEVTDPRDRVPYWLVSCRHPDRLVEAVAGARTSHSQPG